jgi:hypothetical protein
MIRARKRPRMNVEVTVFTRPNGETLIYIEHIPGKRTRPKLRLLRIGC